MLFSVRAAVRAAAIFAFKSLVFAHPNVALLAFELGVDARVRVVRFPRNVGVDRKEDREGLVAERALDKHGGVATDLGADVGSDVVFAII